MAFSNLLSQFLHVHLLSNFQNCVAAVSSPVLPVLGVFVVFVFVFVLISAWFGEKANLDKYVEPTI